MSIRNDVSINWQSSPRVVEVAASEPGGLAITVQDLLDTLRSLSASSNALGYDEIVDASGKEALGADVSVGLTVKLLNAVLKFGDRPPSQWVVCSVSGGNLVAMDHVGQPLNPIAPAAYVNVTLAQSSSATLLGGGLTTNDVLEQVGAGLVAYNVATSASQNVILGIATNIQGLSGENQYIDMVQVDSQGRMISARLRIYSVSSSVGTDANVIDTYTVTATYVGSSTTPATYKVVKA